MRKFILIAGFVLASASVQAADRSLSLAGSDPTAAAAPARVQQTAQVVEAPQAEAPKYQERPALVEPKAEPKVEPKSQARIETPKTVQPAADSAKPAPRKSASREKPRRTRYWTEAHIVRELNRHGIYW
jgi:outer membrane biosynthesis protein TonB